MLNRFLTILLVTVLLNAYAARAAYAKPRGQGSAVQAEKVKTKVGRLYVGQKPRVRVRLNDGRRLKGYIGETMEEGFVVVDPKAGTATTVRYAQVEEVKQDKPREVVGMALLGGSFLLLFAAGGLSGGA